MPTTTATPTSQEYLYSLSVTLAADIPAIIYYTLDGTLPTIESPIYTEPLYMPPDSAAHTLNYFAVDTEGNEEAVQTQYYTHSLASLEKYTIPIHMPPDGGTHSLTYFALTPLEFSAAAVTASPTDADGADGIHYYVDGAHYVELSTVDADGNAVEAAIYWTFTAVELQPESGAITQVYTYVLPTVAVSMPGGEYVSAQTVTLSVVMPTRIDAQTGEPESLAEGSRSAEIFYTLDGSEPYAEGPAVSNFLTNIKKYTKPIYISKTVTLKYCARDEFANTGPTETQDYIINIADIDFEIIEDRILDELKSSLPYAKTVETYGGQLEQEIEKILINFPAAFVVYGGSQFEWIDNANYSETCKFTVLIAAKHLKGKEALRKGSGAAYEMIKDVMAALTNKNLNIEIEKLKLADVSLVYISNTIVVYGIEFQTNFDKIYG